MPNRNIGIDLGTTSVIFHTKQDGVILNEPTVVAYDTRAGKVLAVGEQASRMLGRTPPHIVASRPLEAGVISDYVMTQEIIKQLLGRIGQSGGVKPRVAICVPARITGVEEYAVAEAALEAGARQVYLIDEPIAAAIGAGLDITRAHGHMVVDIGGGTTDIAVVSMGGTVSSASIKTAGNAYNNEIAKHLRAKFDIILGSEMINNLKKEIACVHRELGYNKSFEVKGMGARSHLPMRCTVTTEDLYVPVEACTHQIFLAIRDVLERTPPELAGDILSDGILLTGGGALLGGIAAYLQSKSNVTVRVADEPLLCVAKGSGLAFDFEGKLQDGFREVSESR